MKILRKRRLGTQTPNQQQLVDGFGKPIVQTWQNPANKGATTPAVEVVRTPVSLSPELGKLFRQHSFDTKVTFDATKVMVHISPIAMEKMYYYVGIVADEVSWMGKVTRLNNTEFLIEDVYLIDQDVHPTTTEFTNEGNTEFLTKLVEEEGIEAVNKIRLWGHSHVKMGTTASTVDDEQMKEFSQVNDDYMIRLIANKDGRIELTIYDWNRNLKIADAPWSLFVCMDDELQNAIKEEVKEKVFVKKNTVTTYANQGYNGRNYAGGGAWNHEGV